MANLFKRIFIDFFEKTSTRSFHEKGIDSSTEADSFEDELPELETLPSQPTKGQLTSIDSGSPQFTWHGDKPITEEKKQIVELVIRRAFDLPQSAWRREHSVGDHIPGYAAKLANDTDIYVGGWYLKVDGVNVGDFYQRDHYENADIHYRRPITTKAGYEGIKHLHVYVHKMFTDAENEEKKRAEEEQRIRTEHEARLRESQEKDTLRRLLDKLE